MGQGNKVEVEYKQFWTKRVIIGFLKGNVSLSYLNGIVDVSVCRKMYQKIAYILPNALHLMNEE